MYMYYTCTCIVHVLNLVTLLTYMYSCLNIVTKTKFSNLAIMLTGLAKV